VDANFFEVMGARIASGRGLRESDLASASRIAIVDESWASEQFAGRNPIGQRVRPPVGVAGQEESWIEIVGLVAGMERATGPVEAVAVYLPLRIEERTSVQIYLRGEDRPSSLVPAVHAVVAAIDPSLAVADLEPLEDTWAPVQQSNAFIAIALAVVALIIVLFALIGIYALVSFTVAQRAREIGIRAALGANPRRILVAIFARALLQIGLGLLAGSALVSLTIARNPDGLRLVTAVALALAATGLIACFIPAMRALRIQPTEALRAE
jgi:putative ABC transport system permease protein